MTDVFEGKSLQDLLKDIHDNTVDKRQTIKDIIGDIRKSIRSMDDLVCLAPILKDYLDIMIKNDEHLIKVGTIVQRITSAENYSSGADELLSESEKDALLAIAKTDLGKEIKQLDEKIKESKIPENVK